MGEYVQSLVAQSEGGGAFLTMVLPLVVMVGVMWFFTGRSERKRQTEHQGFLAGLKRGDEIVLNSGIIGKVALVEDRTITLEVSEKVKVRVLKQAISGPAARFLATGEKKTPEKLDAPKADDAKPEAKKA
jgi:preprotein translocase subunit YajC